MLETMRVRERFQRVMAFQPVDQLPALEWIPWWSETLERWYGEGLPRNIEGMGALQEYFGLDRHAWLWFSPRGKWSPRPGRTRQDGQIDSEAEYDEFIAPKFEGPTFDPALVEPLIGPHEAGEIVVWLQIDGFFWFPREVLGIEKHLMAFYDAPDLLKRINDDLCEYNLRLIDELCRYLTPDSMTFAEDMTYNLGPMLSKECFDEFIAPHYRRIVPELKARDIIPMVDTDGDVNTLADWVVEAGIEGIEPLERQAGTDVAEIRRRHPRFKIIGGFDKMIMHKGEAAMRAEFERLLPVMRTGGFIPSVDHQTPPDVSLENYRTYVKLLREYCRLAAET